MGDDQADGAQGQRGGAAKVYRFAVMNKELLQCCSSKKPDQIGQRSRKGQKKPGYQQGTKGIAVGQDIGG